MPAVMTSIARRRQAELGQFLTPPCIADFMASLFDRLPPAVRLLDAGAGAGALTAAFVSRLCKKKDGVRSLEVTVYEIDPLIQASLAATMRWCERACADAGIRFAIAFHAKDFIQDVSTRIGGPLFGKTLPTYDAAIINPPYRKIAADSAERHALRHAGVETTNLYTGFIALIQRLLMPGGQLVGITPRSFCNGPYFRAFREDLLSGLELRRLHVFESRSAAFRDDNVLQENIIIHATKGTHQPSRMVISSSSGESRDAISESTLPFTDVVRPRDPEKFIHIPVSPSHTLAKKALGSLYSDLKSLGLSVSTGRVVDFRLKNFLCPMPQKGTVPLLYPCHFHGASIRWPLPQSRKPNAIVSNGHTRSSLVPVGTYVLTKRFTSKEERRRIVACLFEPGDLQANSIAFENHLNYFHASGCGLDRSLALGLLAFLNSTIVDQYFRRYSGHTQVNATDLRTLLYPDRATLLAMGAEMISLDLMQAEIDELVTRHINGSP